MTPCHVTNASGMSTLTTISTDVYVRRRERMECTPVPMMFMDDENTVPSPDPRSVTSMDLEDLVLTQRALSCIAIGSVIQGREGTK